MLADGVNLADARAVQAWIEASNARMQGPGIKSRH
jgi:hypothetical protein